MHTRAEEGPRRDSLWRRWVGLSRKREDGQWVSLNVAELDRGVALWASPAHIATMAKPKSPRVIFKMERINEGDWQIQAHCPGTEIRYIKGLTSKAEVDEWLAGDRRIAWLRSQGYAK
jgi:hypothetical protein